MGVEFGGGGLEPGDGGEVFGPFLDEPERLLEVAEHADHQQHRRGQRRRAEVGDEVEHADDADQGDQRAVLEEERQGEAGAAGLPDSGRMGVDNGEQPGGLLLLGAGGAVFERQVGGVCGGFGEPHRPADVVARSCSQSA